MNKVLALVISMLFLGCGSQKIVLHNHTIKVTAYSDAKVRINLSKFKQQSPEWAFVAVTYKDSELKKYSFTGGFGYNHSLFTVEPCYKENFEEMIPQGTIANTDSFLREYIVTSTLPEFAQFGESFRYIEMGRHYENGITVIYTHYTHLNDSINLQQLFHGVDGITFEEVE